MNRRFVGVVAALLTALVLSGCAGLPAAGPVMVGLTGTSDSGAPEFVLKPDSPQPGATADEIVKGFIRAGSGPADLWAVAREYLTPEAAATWRPQASVTIDTGERSYSQPAIDAISLPVTQTALVDDTGSYAPTETGSTSLDFHLQQNSAGEWRISQPPDGIVLNQNVFPNVYNRYSLMFFDPTWTYLVPDLRWYPKGQAASRITRALFEGPSEWLASSVSTAVAGSVTAPNTVPVVSGVAQVELGQTAVSVDRTTLDRLQTQLEASLLPAGASSVEMLAAGTPLEATKIATASTAVGASPLVLTEAGFGFLSGDSLDPIAGLSDAILNLPSAPVSIQVSASQSEAAARLTSGTVVRVSADRPLDEVDARPRVVDPTIDRYGFIWSVPRDTPSALWATAASGTPILVPNAWSGASALTAMAISRDGTRLAALVESGGRSAVWIKGVIRASDGTPTGLGSVQDVGTVAGGGVGLAWLDDVTLGVLSTDDEQPQTTEQPVGGPGSTVAAPPGVTAIAGANQTATVRLRDADGGLYVKRSTNWNQTAGGVLVLATQQGSPR